MGLPLQHMSVACGAARDNLIMNLKNKAVLVVDDDNNFRELLSCALADIFSVITAEDGEVGVKLALTMRPDLIILDVMMPRMSGLEVLRALLQDEETASIPVLICTGSDFDAEMRNVFRIERNCAGFFSKTAPLDFLAGTVERTLAEWKK